jgi:holo-[acyl-carrier protein] synthase
LIIGIGNDLIDIRRIEKTLTRFGDRFVERIFTATERAKAERRTESLRASTYAKRYAAKEAVSKALGTGFRRGVFWRDIGVVNGPDGRPTVELGGGAALRLAQLLPAGMAAHIHLTLTDEYPMAEAVVVISAVPAQA